MRVEPDTEGKVIFHFQGRLDAATTPVLWHQAMDALKHHKPKRVTVRAEGITYCDGCGTALLFELQLLAKNQGFKVEIVGMKAEFARLLNMFHSDNFTVRRTIRPRHVNVADEIGRSSVGLWQDFCLQISYVGELAAALLNAIIHPRQVRWRDTLLVAERTGADAVGIVAMLGLLFGLIMAFSSAMPLRQFGVEVYVSDLTAIALVRVLGPFITAVLLAGRSGSAFAAEIGTMKINNEIDALETMGLDPVRFLALPRVLATTVVMPLLAIVASLSGLAGAAVVITSLGFSFTTYTQHVQMAISPTDIFSGLVKAVVHGWLIGAVGCLRGFQTENGPSAVGISATRAVVSGIVLVVLAEGVFAILYHYMGI